MKVTITTTTTKEVELPKYFKQKYVYFMIKDNSYIRVDNIGYEPKLGLFPSIQVESIESLKHYIRDFEPVSESEFKSVFVRVSVLIEEIFSN